MIFFYLNNSVKMVSSPQVATTWEMVTLASIGAFTEVKAATTSFPWAKLLGLDQL